MKNLYFKKSLVAGISLFFVIFVAFALPLFAHAQTGLVVCGAGPNVGLSASDATGCQACHLFQLIDRIIKFLILISVPIASLLFAYAGILYFTSGGGHGVSEAKAIFKDVLFGFVIALCGYLIVDTIIKTLVNGSFTGPSWNTVQCVADSARNITRGSLGFVELGGLQGLLFDESTGAPLVNQNVSTGDCSPAALSSAWGSNASRMSCIINKESTCRDTVSINGDTAPFGSGIDQTAGKDAFSYGRYQINISANKVSCPNGVTHNCPAAFSGKDFGATVVDRKLYNDCAWAAANPACATMTAQDIYNRQGFSAWYNTNNECSR